MNRDILPPIVDPRTARGAWRAVELAHHLAEQAWANYDAALERARLAEDAMWAARERAERLSCQERSDG